MSIWKTFPPALSIAVTASLARVVLRIIPITLWPAFKTRRERMRPRPPEAPVMSQTGGDMMR